MVRCDDDINYLISNNVVLQSLQSSENAAQVNTTRSSNRTNSLEVRKIISVIFCTFYLYILSS